MSQEGPYQSLKDYIHQFNKLPDEAWYSIRKICSHIHLKKNKDLQSIGHACKTIYYVQKGVARIYYYKDENEITECFAFENQIIARAESLFTGNPSKKAIQVLEDSIFIAIPATSLFGLYDQFPEIERAFRKIFESAYVETINRMESIQFHTAEERYNALLKEAPNIIRRIPLKHIASYLGITQVSLSRIRSLK
jgi:CRP-like cAMP-binding protein